VVPEPGEIHQGEAAVVASIVENGPRSAVEVSRDLWPDGMTVSRRTGQPAPKRNPLGDARRKLNALAERQILEVRGDRWHLGHGAGSVWAVYFATNRIFAGVYDANVNLVSHADWRPGRGVEHHDNLDALLSLGVGALAEAVRRAPPRWAPARAVGVGLPAAIEPDRGSVSPTNTQRWPKWSIADRMAEKWASIRREDADALPSFPKLGDAPAVCVDADVVMDTLAAMHPLLGEKLAPVLAQAGIVLGVKHSGGVRSTLINRGAPLVGTTACRMAGTRRDGIFRGTSGDTLGLGHTIALVAAARAEHENDPDFEDVERFAQRLGSNGHACGCGETRLAHLDNLVAAGRVAERLGLEIVRGDLHSFWRQAEGLTREDSLRGDRSRMILEETGRLVGYALDLAARLYDPEVILVTGTLPYNTSIWDQIRETVERATTRGAGPRRMYRAQDIEGFSAIDDPIGPRGAAWLALDTYVYPALIRDTRG